MCMACLPHFIALGPEKTGTTDLYNKMSKLEGVVPAARKETGWYDWVHREKDDADDYSAYSFTLRVSLLC